MSHHFLGTERKEVSLVSHSPAQYMDYLQKKNDKSNLLIFQEEQKKYNLGSVDGQQSQVLKLNVHSFPVLRTTNQQSQEIF